MGSGTYYPAVAGDDGYWVSGIALIDNALNLYIGNNGAGYNSFIRFANVTIPAGATITSAFIRFTSYSSKSGVTVNAACYFNDADDASVPADQDAADALALTTGVAWNALGAWTDGSTYDTPSLVSDLQEVIDRGGWATGQAIMALAKDNSSTASAYRLPSAIEQASGNEKAELHVEWTWVDPNVAATTATLTITPNAATVYVDLTVSPSVVALTITANAAAVTWGKVVSAATATLTITPNAATISYDLDITAATAAKTITANAATISWDLDITATTATLTIAAYDAAIWDGAEWTAWITANAKKLTKLYYFVLTGSADSETDATIPISSWQTRRKDGDPTYLSVVIPGTSYEATVAARTNGDMQINMAYVVDGVEQKRETIVEVDYEEMRVDEGGKSQSITLTGHRTESFTPKTIALQDVVYKRDDDGDLAFRCATPDLFLNPGDTATYDGDEITVKGIVIIVSANNDGSVQSSMEVEEVDA